jgi:peptidyl-tRNA hydrolase
VVTGAWNVLSLHRAGSLGNPKYEWNKYKIGIAALQEIRWKVRMSQKEKGPFESQERDGWTLFKMV